VEPATVAINIHVVVVIAVPWFQSFIENFSVPLAQVNVFGASRSQTTLPTGSFGYPPACNACRMSP
jgi:hypothetical protein